MAIFVCGIDESAGKDRRDNFIMAGYMAPETVWTQQFSPDWEEQVLSGPPRIPYLHMTEIRSNQWRNQYGLSAFEAEQRVDRACDLIHGLDGLVPIGVFANAGDVEDILAKNKVLLPAGGSDSLRPDYLCFMAYAYLATAYIARLRPDAEKIDFIIERNGKITRYIESFHAGLAESFEYSGRSDLAPLIGDLIPAGKERVPLQAADMLCWHTARSEVGIDGSDSLRYDKIAGKLGMRMPLSREYLVELAPVLMRQH